MMRGAILIALGLVLCAGSAVAQVEVVTRPDGRKLIKGKGRPVSHARLGEPARELLERIEHHAREAGLEPRLVQSLIQAESAFDRYAVSHKGAQGLMQLMPQTASTLGVDDPFDIDQNLSGGTRYLRRLLDRYDGDLVLGLAAYNAGPEAVARYEGVPPYRETRAYVRRVLTMYRGEEPVLPASGLLRGRPAFLVRRDGRWLVTSDRKAAEALKAPKRSQPAEPTDASGDQEGAG